MAQSEGCLPSWGLVEVKGRAECSQLQVLVRSDISLQRSCWIICYHLLLHCCEDDTGQTEKRRWELVMGTQEEKGIGQCRRRGRLCCLG